MIPVQQTRIGSPGGNCLAACFASILEIPLAEVDFSCTDAEPGEWYFLALDKLRPHGHTYFELRTARNQYGEFEVCVPDGQFMVVSGKTSRGPLQHSVVYEVKNRRYDFVHDPNPSGAGLIEVTHFGILIPLRQPERNIP